MSSNKLMNDQHSFAFIIIMILIAQDEIYYIWFQVGSYQSSYFKTTPGNDVINYRTIETKICYEYLRYCHIP